MPMNPGDIARKLAGLAVLLETPVSPQELAVGWTPALKRDIAKLVEEARAAFGQKPRATLQPAAAALRAGKVKGPLAALIEDAAQRLNSMVERA